MENKKLTEQLNKCISSGNLIGKSIGIAEQYNYYQCPTECAGRDSFIVQLNSLLPLIKDDFPVVHKLLIEEIRELSNVPHRCVNKFAFGSILILLCVIRDEIENRKSPHKIFISHSSKDERLIKSFADTIFKLGMGFKSEDIFCTSIEEMGVKNGEDMRSHIQTNLNGCDFAFLMISQEYNKSGICLNEMGAVWAYDKKVKTFILPDVNFDSIGWLYDIKKANKINDAIALDALYDEMTEYYSLRKKTGEWGRQRENFLSKMKVNPVKNKKNILK